MFKKNKSNCSWCKELRKKNDLNNQCYGCYVTKNQGFLQIGTFYSRQLYPCLKCSELHFNHLCFECNCLICFEIDKDYYETHRCKKCSKK